MPGCPVKTGGSSHRLSGTWCRTPTRPSNRKSIPRAKIEDGGTDAAPPTACATGLRDDHGHVHRCRGHAACDVERRRSSLPPPRSEPWSAAPSGRSSGPRPWPACATSTPFWGLIPNSRLRSERTLAPFGTVPRNALPGSGSLYCFSDGMRGRGAAVTTLPFLRKDRTINR